MIIKETKVGEGNKIFTIVTENYGKIQASAPGVRSFKSKLSAGCSLFCYSDFIFKKGKSGDVYNIVSADKKLDFFNLRYDIEALALANYVCDLANCVVMPEEICLNVLRLLLNTLYQLENKGYDKKIKPVFELRLMSETGFMPSLLECNRCGSTENIHWFSPFEGIAECKSCNPYPNITKDTLSALKYISSAPQKSVFSFTIDQSTLDALTDIAEKYILHRLEKVPRSLTYLKNL